MSTIYYWNISSNQVEFLTWETIQLKNDTNTNKKCLELFVEVYQMRHNRW